MTESLQARWAHLLSILSSDPNVTARQRGFVNLARPQGLMGSSRLIIEVPNKLTRAVFEEQITAPFRAALHEAFGPSTTALFDVNEAMVPIESPSQDVNEPEQAANPQLPQLTRFPMSLLAIPPQLPTPSPPAVRPPLAPELSSTTPSRIRRRIPRRTSLRMSR